ncbi:MAG: hypothetical protein RL220_834 [Bacteroidota bacterium]
MKTLIKSVTILDKRSPHHGKKRDVLIEKGRITDIASTISNAKGRVIQDKELYLSPGWIDMQADFADPGYEFREELYSGTRAARAGGFTRVVLLPSVLPVADTKGAIEYLTRRSPLNGVHLLPAGALSEQMQGKQMAELFDMHLSGAVAFTDGKESVGTELLVRSLEYTRNFDGLVITFPLDKGVNPKGQMHEGKTSVSMGVKGLPGLSEEIRISRDLDLLRYAGGRLHISLISSARSVQLIRQAKKEGLNVTCGIAAHQLSFTDADMAGFDSNLKVLPPFRENSDIKAIIEGLKDGTIDVICSDHSPYDTEHKKREFEDASFGISGIQTAFNAILSSAKGLPVERIADALSTRPAGILKVDLPVIDKGADAELTLFSTHGQTEFTDKTWMSRSRNSPFFNTTMPGRVIEVFTKD